MQIWIMNVDGSGLRRLTHDTLQDDEPAWSPNGRWIAYAHPRHNASDGGIWGHTRRRDARAPALERQRLLAVLVARYPEEGLCPGSVRRLTAVLGGRLENRKWSDTPLVQHSGA
jgi:Tol biopolymer transport system component